MKRRQLHALAVLAFSVFVGGLLAPPPASAFSKREINKDGCGMYYPESETTTDSWHASAVLYKGNNCLGLLSVRGVGLTGSFVTVTTSRYYDPDGSGPGFSYVQLLFDGQSFGGAGAIPTGGRHYACNDCGYWST